MAEAEGTSYDIKLTSTIMQMFPDACPNYVKRISKGKVYGQRVVAMLVAEILCENCDYPRRKQTDSSANSMSKEDKLLMLKEVFPDADTAYLSSMVLKNMSNSPQFRLAVNNLLEKRNYPRKDTTRMQPANKRQEILSQQKQYTTDFSIEDFLKLIPDPKAFFTDPKRKPSIPNVQSDDRLYASECLKNIFVNLPVLTISNEFRKSNYNVVKTAMELDKIIKSRNQMTGAVRKSLLVYKKTQNIPLLQELAYVKYRKEIQAFLITKKKQAENERRIARRNGRLRTCNCCYDSEVMPFDVLKCENGCEFCKECVARSVEISAAEAKTQFACLNNCQAKFSLRTLQLALTPKLFSIIAKKIQMEEVMAAGIQGLETCPFCEFANIMANGDKVFQCLNEVCMKQSCRLCKEPSHIPFRCDEVEKDEDTKARIYIEKKMTEAMVRKCYQCGVQFFKLEGCNKMACTCGATMCYLCGQPVQDYSHFNGQGGDQYDKCPLFVDNEELHENEALQAAKKAKSELGISNQPKKKMSARNILIIILFIY